MKTQNYFLMMFIALVLMVSNLILADSMGTAFTYQGRLLEDGEPGTGTYDLQCKLFDSKTNGTQIGDTLVFEDGSGDDGYFTVHIDFGVNIFNGEERHLEMAFRPWESTDPNDFVILSDRVELTPTPYALYAKSAGSAPADNDWMVSGDDMYSIPSGNVGIGTTSPGSTTNVKFEVVGSTAILEETGSYGLIFDEIGSAMRIYSDTLSGGSGRDFILGVYPSGHTDQLVLKNDGKVGIGTEEPTEKLDVNGNIHISGNITKDVSGGTMARAIPIAYAFINSDGSVASGTPNVSCSWNATNINYEITIAGESYFWTDYVTVVTVTDSNPPRIATTASVSGKLIVNINNVLTGTELQAPFQFITYKP